MKFPDILKSLRLRDNINQNDLAKALGVSRSAIGMYESGKREPDFETLEAIADYFNVSMDYLHGKSNYAIQGQTTQFTPKDNSLVFKNKVTFPPPYDNLNDNVTFPVIGEVAAGYDFPAIEDWDGETVDIPRSYLNGRNHDNFFVLRVKGDSMYPDFQDGDKVLVLKQSTLNYSGQVGVVLYDGELATLKKVEYKMGEDWMRFVAINPTYPPKLIENEDLELCRVLGIPKMLIREIPH